MKKTLSIALCLVMLLSFGFIAQAAGTEVAMITDIGTIDDKSFNQGTWEGIKQYCDAAGKSYNYYQPASVTTDAYLEKIDQAVADGAKVIVTPGFLFADPIYIAQDKYPDVHFILIDATPLSASGEARTNPNAVGVVYAEEQAAYLAGYAAVTDGMTKLGFMGGAAVPAVVRFGYGFVQGADAAAQALGITDLSINYYYTGNFDATPEAMAMAAGWYQSGVEVIFACGGAVGNSVMAAAEAQNKKVIGVDVDQSGESQTVITSAMKELSATVVDMLDAYFTNHFPGGENLTFGAAENKVSLPMATSKFEHFDQAQYDELFARLASGEIELQCDQEAASADQLNIQIAKVTVIQ